MRTAQGSTAVQEKLILASIGHGAPKQEPKPSTDQYSVMYSGSPEFLGPGTLPPGHS